VDIVEEGVAAEQVTREMMGEEEDWEEKKSRKSCVDHDRLCNRGSIE
jgi:hypothetical protein